jgi:hypothetical protein
MMLVTFNGEQQDLPVVLKRARTALEQDELTIGDRRATRVTHSLSDDIPVIVQADELIFELPRRDFYGIAGMDYDWQPGNPSQSISGAER